MRHFTLVLAVSIVMTSGSAVFAKPAGLPTDDMSQASDVPAMQIVVIEEDRETAAPILVAKGAIDTAFMRRLRF